MAKFVEIIFLSARHIWLEEKKQEEAGESTDNTDNNPIMKQGN